MTERHISNVEEFIEDIQGGPLYPDRRTIQHRRTATFPIGTSGAAELAAARREMTLRKRVGQRTVSLTFVSLDLDTTGLECGERSHH